MVCGIRTDDGRRQRGWPGVEANPHKRLNTTELVRGPLAIPSVSVQKWTRRGHGHGGATISKRQDGLGEPILSR